jgi:thiol-disulfide isomerase/thioredoxin
MKKGLLTFLGFLTLNSYAQIIWQEDFSGTTAPAIPATWSQNNLDGFTPNAGLAALSFGTNAWVTRDMAASMPAYGKIAASTSWYTPVGASNDWLITPAFTPLTNSFLDWEASAPDAQFLDGYVVKISPTGGSMTTDFTVTALTVTAENNAWTRRGIDLNAYAGTSIRVAIINNSNNKFILYVDNIKAQVPNIKDGNVTSVVATRYATTGMQTIAGTFRSLGYTPVTNATLNYQVGAGAPISQTFTFSPALTFTQSTNYSFTTQANVPVGTQNIKVWVSNVNGSGADTNPINDTAKVLSYVASQSVARNVLIEEFTSSTCPPCASLNATFDPLLNTNNPNTAGNVNVIKYNMDYPGNPGNDPSFNAHGNTRHTFYGVSGIPTAIINGRAQMSAHSQAEIDGGKTEPAYANIVATVSRAGNVVTASAVVTPYLTIPNALPIKAFQVLAEQFYNYPGASTSQKNYYHVMRKMNPNGFGAEITSMTSGTPFNLTFNNTFNSVATPAQNSFDLWNSNNNIIEYIVYLQDTVSGHIIQSGSGQAAPTGLIDLNENQTIGMYPNPAKDFTTLAIKTDNTSIVEVKVFDLFGRVVYKTIPTKLNSGKNEISFNTSNLLNGIYNVVVTSDGHQVSEKLSIAH